MLSLQSHEPQGQRIRQHQSHPAILSLSILCPEIAVQRWQMGLQVLHSQHSKGVSDLCSVLICYFHPSLTCCCSSKSPLPQLDPREQNLLVAGTATKPDLQSWAVTILSSFCYKHTLLNRAEFSISQGCTCDLNSQSQTSALVWKCLASSLWQFLVLSFSWCRSRALQPGCPRLWRRRGTSCFDSLCQVLSHHQHSLSQAAQG